LKVVRVAIRVNTAAPANVGHPLERVLRLLLQDLGELELRDLGIDVSPAQLRLNQTVPAVTSLGSPRWHKEFKGEARFPNRLHQRFRAFWVGLLVWLEGGIVRKVRRCNRPVPNCANAEERLVEQFLAIQCNRPPP